MSIFTKIISREIPSDILYENDEIIAIKDIKPQAKVHILIISKKEIPTINDLENSDKELLANMFFVAKNIAKDLWIQEGYKLSFNVWKKGWQEIMHLHLHLLSDI
jgi:histidine triad (HIT) family protein